MSEAPIDDAAILRYRALYPKGFSELKSLHFEWEAPMVWPLVKRASVVICLGSFKDDDDRQFVIRCRNVENLHVVQPLDHAVLFLGVYRYEMPDGLSHRYAFYSLEQDFALKLTCESFEVELSP